MRWEKVLGKYLLIGIMLTITGCEKRPEVSIREGIAFADSAVSDRKHEFVMIENNKEENIATSIDTEIVSEISTMKIKAQINSFPVECEAFTGIVKCKTINIDNMYEILFGDMLGNQINSDDISENDGANIEKEESVEPVDSHFLLNGEHVGTWTLMDENNRKEIAELSIDENGILAYINLELNEKYPNNTSISVEPLGETDAPNTALTREEAINKLLDIINKMEGPEIEVINCLAYQDTKGKGYYELSFVPIFQGIALTNDLPTFSNNSIATIFGRAVITEDGLMELIGNFMIKYKDIKNTGNILTEEEIIEVLTSYINNGKIITTSEVPVCQIKFEYLTKYMKGEITVIPIWRLYFDEEKLGNIDTTEFLAGGIGIDANNGELEFAY